MTFMFASEPTDVPGLGLLRPLTLKQIAELRVEIQRDLMLLTSQGLSGAEKGYAAAAIAMQVAEMDRYKQAGIIVHSPMLMAHAVRMMLNDAKLTTAAAVLPKIKTENIDAIGKAIIGSYGFEVVTQPDATTDGDDEADPQTTAGSSEAAAA